MELKEERIEILFNGEYQREFTIPIYQRPYSWTTDQCEQLWDDLKEFTSSSEDNQENKYFLGSIVTFKNENNKHEVIDGQQRLTTLTLLLKAFEIKTADKENIKEIKKCLWKLDKHNKPSDNLRIDSTVAYQDDKNVFEDILKLDPDNDDISKKIKEIKTQKANKHYIDNFEYFVNKINTSLTESRFITEFADMLFGILNNCIVLHIKADNQEDALRIFSTLNNRGLPLADADIFKAKMYDNSDNRETFIKDWQYLEKKCDIFEEKDNNPIDELFTMYMYYLRTKNNIKSSTTIGLRNFFETEQKDVLTQKEKIKETIDNLKLLVDFWDKIYNENFDNKETQKRLNVLKYAPNKMWKYIVSVYYMFNQENSEKEFVQFLDKTIAFFWGATVNNITLGSCKGPIFKAMANIKNKENIELVLPNETNEENTRNSLEIYSFTNGRPITRAMLMWWSVLEKKEDLNTATKYDIEHIYSRNFQKELEGLEDNKYLEFLGNKSLLEKRVNILASDNGFEVKCRNYYKYSKIEEMQNIGEKYKYTFGQEEIIKRNDEMIDAFIQFLKDNNVLATTK